MSGIVAGGGWWFRYSVSVEARAKAEAQIPPLRAEAGLLQKLDRRFTVWTLARSFERGAKPSRHSLY